MAGEQRRGHIVMLPLMAQGHIIPFFELGKLLAKQGGFLITIVNTPRNVLRLLPKVSTACKAHDIDIRLEELPFPRGTQGLPPDVENTDSLPYNLMFLLVRNCEQLERPFENLLWRLRDGGHPPTCVVSDMFFGWTLDICNRMGIPRATFMTMGAFATAVYYSLWMNLPHKKTDSDTFSLAPELPHVSFHTSQLPLSLRLTDDTDPWHLFLKRQIPRNLRSWGTLLNTFDALESKFVDHLRSNSCGHVWTVGPVLPEAFNGTHGCCTDGLVHETCSTWLDSLPPSSVLYISFGTMVRISRCQMEALALGLEATRVPFIWAVRPPCDVTDESADFLPEGFEERMVGSKQGLLLKGWAPQLLILSHPSTGGFLSHCGWNSTLESLSQGVPMIGWPIAADQFYNSKLLEEEVGVSVEICRGVDGELHQSKVEKIVRMFMEGDLGMELRKKARQLRDTAKLAFSSSWVSTDGKTCKGSSIANIDEFVNEVNLLVPSPES
ncbi:hypothetical protein SUGI_0038530 [Cryptomeria japonica]|uniref:UDP-glycosyltransferase 92A1 n=1 Tax=Cryptomeria japonica TaxID=3369 RepID=UPI002408B0BC|nr:UDP-glycosyltransferase 92A1 [Cryptomeria japonica]GLJ06415.1 hypothetical protein SUGI_0038530 [Cryptomeria japonica]